MYENKSDDIYIYGNKENIGKLNISPYGGTAEFIKENDILKPPRRIFIHDAIMFTMP